MDIGWDIALVHVALVVAQRDAYIERATALLEVTSNSGFAHSAEMRNPKTCSYPRARTGSRTGRPNNAENNLTGTLKTHKLSRPRHPVAFLFVGRSPSDGFLSALH